MHDNVGNFQQPNAKLDLTKEELAFILAFHTNYRSLAIKLKQSSPRDCFTYPTKINCTIRIKKIKNIIFQFFTFF